MCGGAFTSFLQQRASPYETASMLERPPRSDAARPGLRIATGRGTLLAITVALFVIEGCSASDSTPHPSTVNTESLGGASVGAGSTGDPPAGGGSVSVTGGTDNATRGGTDSSESITGVPAQNRMTPPERVTFGFTPATVYVEDARAAYDAWKSIHLEDCGNGVQRVRWENERADATVSEGIGYGMLLTAIWDERAAFDGLYAYYQLGQNPDTGLMNWLRYGCDAHHEETYSAHPGGAAADADLDVAMALIMANCRWGDAKYTAAATQVISAIRQHMFIDDNGTQVLLPGDSGWFHQMGAGCLNYSYFAPAYYREFAKLDAEHAALWLKAANDSYVLLAAASHQATGLVRNWGAADGQNATPWCHDAYNRAASYGDDAARTPWRIVTDYLWNGTPAAKGWTDKVTQWVASKGIQTTAQWYNLDGTPDVEAGTWDDHTAINVGPWATGAMSYDQATVDAFASELLAIPAGKSDHDGEYFPRMLKALTLSTLVGKFTTCGGADR